MQINKNQKSGIFLLLIVAVVIICSAVLVISMRSDPVAENLKKDQIVKILYVLENNGKALSTNIFVYYAPSHRGALVNVPGNTGAIYESLGRVDRIDEIYAEKGIAVYKSELEKLCGIEIPFYVILKLDNFSKLTDMMGGMKVLVSEPVDTVSATGERWLLPSGAVQLDGDKIATYITYMLPDESESDSSDRRQNVLVSFLEALNRNSSKMLAKKHFHQYAEKIISNVNEDNLRKLFTEIQGVDSERIVPQTVTGMERMVDDKRLLFPYYDGQLVKDVVKQTMNLLISESGTMSSRIYVLEIENGTNVQGLAHNTAALLQSAGYDVLTTLNADTNGIEKTQIVDHIGNAEAAKNLADFIHCKNVVEEAVKDDSTERTESGADVDFTIVLGRDFDGRYVH